MSIFLPAEGFSNNGSQEVNRTGYYWTNEASYFLKFSSSNSYEFIRGYGTALGNIYRVRGVCK